MAGVDERGVDPRGDLVLDPVVDPAEVLERPAGLAFRVERLVEIDVSTVAGWLTSATSGSRAIANGGGVAAPAAGRGRVGCGGRIMNATS